MTIRLLHGDCRDALKSLPDASVHCCITSPPYWGLRSYLPAGHPDKPREIGSEPTVDEWVSVMVEVFREVRRVLLDDGVLFLNLGDSYAGSQRAHAHDSACKAESSYQDRDSTSESPDDGRIDARSRGTGGIDGRRALAQASEPLTQIRACMEELHAHLPIEGSFRPIPSARSSSAILGLAQTAIRAVERLLASLESKTPGFSLPPPAGSRPLNTLSACLSSLHAFAACVRRCAYMLDGLSGIPERTAGTASLCEELAHHIRCTSEWCSIVLSWVEYKPQRSTLKPKDLIGQPWRVAFALQADGWYLRQEIIWAKKNPMPESVRDRFTKAHEHVFLLSKRERYYFDFDAVQEDASEGTHARLPGNRSHKHTAAYEAGDEKARTKAGLVAYAERQRAKCKLPHNSAASRKERANEASKSAPTELHNGMRAPTPKAALASSGNDGAYSDGKSERMGRGAGWRERKLAEAGSGTKNNGSFDEAMAVMPQTRNPRSVRWLASEPFRGAHFATYPPELIRPFVLAGCPPGGTVLDPFGGSGTTGLVCDQEGRDAILIDLDERNLPMARERIASDAPLFAEVVTEA